AGRSYAGATGPAAMTRERIEQAAWTVGLIGLVVTVIGWIVTPRLFPHAWLAALACWIGWPLGSMALLLIHSISGGRWGYAIRPQLMIGVMSLPLAVLAVLPLIPELHALYPWARSEVAQGLGNTAYLNVPFVCGRGVLYLALWLLLGALILRALRRPAPDPALYRLAPFGLIMLMLTATFAGYDATLSLDPHFNSSIYGMIMAGEAVLLALSVATFFALLVSDPGPRATADLGKLLLGLLVLWGYFVFMQLLIVWNSDLAIDAPWYVARSQRGWGIVAYITFAAHFAVPFLLLIWPQVQASRRGMLIVSFLLTAGEVPRAWWLVIPAAGRSLSWLDCCAMIGMIGVAVGLALRIPRLSFTHAWVHQHG
ncbi:MAG TPA: hypothetical protein VFW75_13585, partial [Acetobacteraceae bacterium]|nr:hypothetical protein [Acetobacteraceae bacterium]